MVIADINPTLKGWYEYFQHSRQANIRHAGRLDTPSAAEHAAQTAGTGGDRQGARCGSVRWPNAYFAKHGLFSLQGAHDAVRQSP